MTYRATKVSSIEYRDAYCGDCGIVHKDLAVDPTMPWKTVTPPWPHVSQGPLRVNGHTPGCRNAYGDGITDDGKRIGLDLKPGDCPCGGKEAEAI